MNILIIIYSIFDNNIIMNAEELYLVIEYFQ
jgi:hypothetical protein